MAKYKLTVDGAKVNSWGAGGRQYKPGVYLIETAIEWQALRRHPHPAVTIERVAEDEVESEVRAHERAAAAVAEELEEMEANTEPVEDDFEADLNPVNEDEIVDLTSSAEEETEEDEEPPEDPLPFKCEEDPTCDYATDNAKSLNGHISAAHRRNRTART